MEEAAAGGVVAGDGEADAVQVVLPALHSATATTAAPAAALWRRDDNFTVVPSRDALLST